MRNFFAAVMGLLALTGVFLYFRINPKTLASQVYALSMPCARPVTYKLVSIDPRFGLSTSSALSDLETSARIWNVATGKTLFGDDEKHGTVRIAFVYDDRQATSQKFADLKSVVARDQAAYAASKADYDAAASGFSAEKASLISSEAALNARYAAYQGEVSAWNKKGGAPPAEYDKLQAEEAQLQKTQSELSARESMLDASASSTNGYVTRLNAVVAVLNGDVDTYNDEATSSRDSFEEGEFDSAAGQESITIYEYDSALKLTRVLAHELGHSLGLQHVQDPESIMYPLNQGTSLSATADDIAELDRVCRVK